MVVAAAGAAIHLRAAASLGGGEGANPHTIKRGSGLTLSFQGDGQRALVMLVLGISLCHGSSLQSKATLEELKG